MSNVIKNILIAHIYPAFFLLVIYIKYHSQPYGFLIPYFSGLIAFFITIRIKSYIRSKRRRKLKNVKPGELIYIEWDEIKGGIGMLRCINNEPQNKKILLMAIWNNEIKETGEHKNQFLVCNYDSEMFKNFSLLNPIDGINIKPVYDFDTVAKKIDEKQIELESAIEKQEFEKAEILKNEIEKLRKRLK